MKRLSDKLLDFPWGVVGGICAIVAFYGFAAFIGVDILLSGVAAQTNETVSMFENWWQTLIFIVSLLAAVVAVGALVMYIIRAVTYKRECKAPLAETQGENA